MAVSQGQFTIFEHIDGHTPVLGEDYFPAPYVANIIWQYYLSDSVKVLSPTTETTITFDDGTTATVGTWIDIVSESAIPIVKGLINGVTTTYYRFRRQKYIWSDHTVENPHITYSSEHLDETDQRILEWCLATDSIYMDGSSIAAGTITADQIDTSTLIVGENIQMGSSAKISWNNVTDKDSVALKNDVSTAKNEAISVASDDATSKANAAQTNAINTASSDATNKANAAKSGAISEIEGKGYQTKSQVTEITETTITTKELTAEKLHVKAANIDGTLTAKQINIEIGGRNLLRNTQTFEGWPRAANVTAQNGVITWSAVSSLGWNSIINRDIAIKYADIRDKEVTLSFEVRCDEYETLNSQTSNGLIVNLALFKPGAGSRFKYTDVNYFQYTLSDNWKRIEYTFTASDSFFKLGEDEITPETDNFVIGLYNYSLYLMQIRNLKLEKGNKATDWTPSPEELGGWYVDSSGVYMKDGQGNHVVGMHSGDDMEYNSLVTPDTTSPVRFYAGEWHEAPTDRERAKTLTFPTSDGGWSQSIVLTEEEQTGAFISSAECLTTNQTHSISESYNVTISASTTWQGSGYPITAQTITIPISYTAANDNVTITTASSVHSLVNFDYKGGGQVYISGYSRQSGNQSMNIQYSYQYEEILNVNVTHNSSTITCILVPEFTDTDYSINIEYTVAQKPPNFQVLEDGSLYASATSISGHVEADSGSIGNLTIAGGGLRYELKNNKVYSLNEAGLVFEKTDARIQVGDINISYDEEEKNTLISTSGPLVIRGQDGTRLAFMQDEAGVNMKSDVSLHCQSYTDNKDDYFLIWLEVKEFCVDTEYVDIEWETLMKVWYDNDKYTHLDGGTMTFRFDANTKTTGIKRFEYGTATSVIRFKYNNKSDSWTDMIPAFPDETTDYSYQIDFIEQVIGVSDKNIYVTGNLSPSFSATDDDQDGKGEGGYNLGGPKAYWNTVYAKTSTINTSDRNEKNAIAPLSDIHEQIFDALKPVSYKFNINNSDRTHTGLIAQDVKEAVENAGLTTQEFAGYCEWTKADGIIGCGLRYDEFIALCVNEIQKLKKRVNELEEKLDNTK